jgi:hypothetical protein
VQKIFLKMLLCVAALCCASAQAADVGVSLQFGQPGFYGQLDLGSFQQQPQLLYREPRIIERVTIQRAPLYLMVPPGHSKHWEKHCYKYDACGRPVYFVQERWYNEVIVPRYRDDRYQNHNHHRHHDDDDDDDDHGHGHNHGKGKGHGRGNRDD